MSLAWKVSPTIVGQVEMPQSVPAEAAHMPTIGLTSAVWPDASEAPRSTIERMTRPPATEVPTGTRAVISPCACTRTISSARVIRSGTAAP